MIPKSLKLEGTWEEIAQSLAQLAGQRVRVTIILDEPYWKIAILSGRSYRKRQIKSSRPSLQKMTQKEPESLLEATPTALSEQRAIQPLVEAGLVTPPSRRTDIDPVPEEMWHELTERLLSSGGKPLSEIIIEERGSW